MTAYDLRARATAARLLNTISGGGKGQAVTLSHDASGAYNPATSSVALTTTSQNCTGVVLEYPITVRSKGGTRDEANSLVLAGDRQLLLSALDSDGSPLNPPPQINDHVMIAGVTYVITAIAPLSPAGTPILFDCNIQGAN